MERVDFKPRLDIPLFQFQLGTIGTLWAQICIVFVYHLVAVAKIRQESEKNVDVGKLISDGAMTTVFQSGTMLSKNSNFNFHEQY